MSIKINQPMTRFGGWQVLGHIKRPADTRTKTELLDTINAWAQKNPEIKAFLPKLKNVEDKHLGLVADVIELSNHSSFLPKDINLKGPTSLGVSISEFFLNAISILSKENPNVLDFTQEVINNTDTITSKHFLWHASGKILFDKGVSEHFKAAKSLVEPFAKQSLANPSPILRDSEDQFMGLIKLVVNEDADAKKVAVLGEAMKKVGDKAYFYIDEFVTSKVPTEKVEDNLNTLEQVAKLLNASEQKPMNAGEYLTRNTNLY